MEGRIECPDDPPSHAGGNLVLLAGSAKPDWSTREGTDKKTPWSSRLGVVRWVSNPPHEKRCSESSTKTSRVKQILGVLPRTDAVTLVMTGTAVKVEGKLLFRFSQWQHLSSWLDLISDQLVCPGPG